MNDVSDNSATSQYDYSKYVIENEHFSNAINTLEVHSIHWTHTRSSRHKLWKKINKELQKQMRNAIEKSIELQNEFCSYQLVVFVHFIQSTGQ